jgi:hypothetical protein
MKEYKMIDVAGVVWFLRLGSSYGNFLIPVKSLQKTIQGNSQLGYFPLG